MEANLDHFGQVGPSWTILNPLLKEAVIPRRPAALNTAVSYAKLKESMSSQSGYDEILKKLTQIELQAQQKCYPANQVSNVSYTDPVKQSQEIARLRAEIKQLKQAKYVGNNNMLRPNNRNLRTVDG